jgi:hypothetical protein
MLAALRYLAHFGVGAGFFGRLERPALRLSPATLSETRGGNELRIWFCVIDQGAPATQSANGATAPPMWADEQAPKIAS